MTRSSSRRKELMLALGLSIAIHAVIVVLLASRTKQLSIENNLAVTLVDRTTQVSTTTTTVVEKAVRKVSKPKIAAANRISDPPKPNGLLKKNVVNLLPQMDFAEMSDSAPAKIPAPHDAPNLRDIGNGNYAFEKKGWLAKITREGRVEFDGTLPRPKMPFNPEFLTMAFKFDLTELVMRLRGEALHAPQKQKFIDETKELRLSMAKDVRNENLVQSIFELRAQLLTIWENSQLSIAEKKQRLFAMWDECAEEGPEDLIHTSLLIRASIVGFVRRYLPPDSDIAYSPTDLALFNKSRRSAAEFEPYSA